ncbi:DUF742 domain-containing protein [Streptomyces sp. NPDC090021]|uniref:DUF742 domain-containing protein n=1 Tax=Streptomyces sp. NPDC090021 TaxID=3365919 RepID=UPI0037F10862
MRSGLPRIPHDPAGRAVWRGPHSGPAHSQHRARRRRHVRVAGGADGAAETPFGPRPYTLTRGRTTPSRVLHVETLVQSRYGGPGPCPSAVPEHDVILRMCAEPKSLAEVSALLGMPLGITRVMIADLADVALLTVHEQAEGSASTALLERILRGLNRL